MVHLSAAVRHEAVLAYAAALSRTGACVLLVTPTLSAGPSARWLPAVLLATGGYSLVTAYGYRRSRRITRPRALRDLACYSIAMCACALAQSSLSGLLVYNHVIMLALVFGAAPWPLWAAVASGGWLGLLSAFATVVIVGERGAVAWNTLTEAMNITAVTAIAWIVSARLRRLGRQRDEAYEQAARHAQEFAVRRERAALAESIDGRLVETLRQLVGTDAVRETRLREQLRTDIAWMSEHLAGRQRPPDGDLLSGLRRLIEEKTRLGLVVSADLPERLPALSPAQVDALVEGAREALNNVGKHAGTRHARLTVRKDATGLAVIVADAGSGFDTGSVPPGIGLDGSIRGRIAQAGGRATIESRPAWGTVVTLWLPAST
ncbi:ATP-binding protein [Nonomuraea sp. NPDC049419]|uniref:sensor histidine kinase n=1 Tax=unclassified Nonomuraea TaxID=2593643 RepID=UPI003425FA5E